MTNKCVLCKKRSGKSGGLSGGISYHRIPNDGRRKVWLEALGISDENIGKWTYVCSNHFKNTDFIKKKSGVRILKVTAVPETFKQESSSPCQTKTSEQLFSRTGEIQDNNEVEMEGATSGTLTATDISDTLTASENLSEHEMPLYGAVTVTDSSITLTASENIPEQDTYFISVSSDLSNDLEPPRKKRKTTRKAFVGDFTSEDFDTPIKAKRAFNIAKKKVMSQKKKIDALRKQNARFRSRITSLTSLLNYLKRNNYISETAQESIEASFPAGTPREVINRMLKGSRGEKYSPTLRAFALTLHFYSPRAYIYVRDKFNKSLPHPSTIKKWYQNIDGSPGFSQEALTALKTRAELSNANGRRVYCNLVMDEMSIRKKTEWIGSKFYGGIDIGANLEGDNLPEAKEVLVFLVTCINGHWKIPVGYFCIDGLSGSERANLVNNCLELLYETGINIISLTFDGAACNISMAKKLGVDLSDTNNLKTYFMHPLSQAKVFVFLDICHMMKLVRNCFGDHKILKTGDGKSIQWSYLQLLVDFQNQEGLTAATKIKKRHMQFVREKMKVKIASQTLSKSVCDALRYLEKDLKLSQFQGAEETAEFCEMFNDLFDIFNSRNLYSSYIYKKALSVRTKEEFFKKFDDAKSYISNLHLDEKKILLSKRKTGFLGFLMGIESLKGLYLEYVEKSNALKFILGYKFSQDHLETFFSSVRSMHGFNNNPTARQFQSAFKKLLISKEVRGADTANTVTLDNTLILNVSSRKITLNDCNEDLECTNDYVELCSYQDDHDLFSCSGWQLSSFVEDVVIYIAGFVLKSLKKCVTCSKCISLLESNETFSLLQKRKTYGKLFKASKFLIDVCTWGEKSLRKFGSNIFSPKYKNIMNILTHDTLRCLPERVFAACGDHIFDGELLDNHQLSLIKLILKRYFTIRMHHETRKKSDQLKNRVRSLFTHLILYQNQ